MFKIFSIPTNCGGLKEHRKDKQISYYWWRFVSAIKKILVRNFAVRFASPESSALNLESQTAHTSKEMAHLLTLSASALSEEVG